MKALAPGSRLLTGRPCFRKAPNAARKLSLTAPRRFFIQGKPLPKRTGAAEPGRKHITVVSDDGHLQWQELSRGEKAARATQQSFNFLVVIAGLVATGAVITVLYLEVFAPDSTTRQFNRAADRVKSDRRCLEVLGPAREIKAYGEPSWSRWARNRRIASRVEKDRTEREHFYMHFYVEGPLNKGTVRVHMIRPMDQNAFEYQYLFLDVKGHQRIYLENAEAERPDKRASEKLFGIRWR